MKPNFSLTRALGAALILSTLQSIAAGPAALAVPTWVMRNPIAACVLIPIDAAKEVYEYCVSHGEDRRNPVAIARDYAGAQAYCAEQGGRLPTAYELAKLANPRGIHLSKEAGGQELPLTSVDEALGLARGATEFYYAADKYVAPTEFKAFGEKGAITLWTSTPARESGVHFYIFQLSNGLFVRDLDQHAQNQALCVPTEGLGL